jgi:hypothetical protein
MKINLPAEPVDGYKITWYMVEGADLRVSEYRLVYHAHRAWREVCPNDHREGAGFHDQWQVFENGRFESRTSGWHLISYWHDQFERGYATRQEANAEARRLAEARIVRLRRETENLEARLASGDLSK